MRRMKILVTVASGTLGGVILHTLLAVRHEVRVVVGQAASLGRVPAAADAVVTDLQDKQQAAGLTQCLQGIVHAAQVRTEPGPWRAVKEAAVAVAAAAPLAQPSSGPSMGPIAHEVANA